MKNKLIKIINPTDFYSFFELKHNFYWRCELKENDCLILLDQFSNFYSKNIIDSLGSAYTIYKNVPNNFTYYNLKTNEIGVFDIDTVQENSLKYFKILT